MKRTETRTAIILFDENRILEITIKDGVRLDYEDAIDNYLVIKDLTGDEPVKRLTDFSNSFAMDSKARTFIKGKEVRNKTLVRAVVLSGLIRYAGFWLYLRLFARNQKTKIFLHREKAYQWLLALDTL